MSVKPLSRILRSLSIEWYVIFLPSLAALVFMTLATDSAGWKALNDYHFMRVVKHIFFENPILGNALLYPVFYLVARWLIVRLPVGAKKHMKSSELLESFTATWSALGFLRVLYWTLIFFVFCYSVTLAIGVLFHTFDHAQIAFWSERLMQLDNTLFGFYPPYLIQSLGWVPILSTCIIMSYVGTPLLLGAIFIVLLFSNIPLLRRFFIVTAFAFLLAFPLWYLVPALTPNEMYRHNIFELPIPEDVREVMSQHPSAPLALKHMAGVEAIWIDPEKKTTAVSTMPSMHMVWGMEIALFGYLWSRRRYAIVWVTYMVGNTLGTMLLLQHYAVDLIVGAFVALCSFGFAALCMRLERWYFRDHFALLPTLELFTRDARAVTSFTSRLFKRR